MLLRYYQPRMKIAQFLLLVLAFILGASANNGDSYEGNNVEEDADLYDLIDYRGFLRGGIATSQFLEDELRKQLEYYLTTGKKTRTADNIFNAMSTTHVFRYGNDADPIQKASICLLCRAGVRLLIDFRKNGASDELLSKYAKEICVTFKIENENVCNGVIDLNIPHFLYIFDHKPDLSPKKVCSILAQSLDCSDCKNDWDIDIPPRNTKAVIPKKKNSQSPVKILQITDIHYDEYYKPGANNDCGEPLCCGYDQGEPADESKKAGNWGDYKDCDMPWYAVEMLMKEVNKIPDLDYVYYTGDIINHRVWMTTQETNLLRIKEIYNEFAKSLNVTVFPVIGNHEPNPLDVFAPSNITNPGLSSQWLFDELAELWQYWLPKETQETIRKGGYYTVLVRPGFRIIALNSNVAYIYNWWLLYNDSDPFGQLQWLVDTLHQAELAGEKVHIISHVPTGDATTEITWAHNFVKIVERFSDTITAQFNGHTHYDEMIVYFDTQDLKTVRGIAYNGGSFTTYQKLNPNFRVYSVNDTNWMVEDYDMYSYNLTEANKHDINTPPVWYKLYSFKEAYGVPSMSFEDMGNLVKKMAKNQHLLDMYFRYKVREGEPCMLEGCDQKCHEKNLCNIVMAEYGNKAMCNELIKSYRSSKWSSFFGK